MGNVVSQVLIVLHKGDEVVLLIESGEDSEETKTMSKDVRLVFVDCAEKASLCRGEGAPENISFGSFGRQVGALPNEFRPSSELFL